MKAYINASGVLSPQETFNGVGFPDKIREFSGNRLICLEPEYRELINPLQLRRMPRILKMGLAASHLCLNRAGGIDPDAIIVGTGLGCLDNLEKFLNEILLTNEHVTSVLPFINSTHNAVAAQVAMMLQNHAYNVTYCHRNFSFESALDDALLQLEELPGRNILVGGIDECTDDFVQLNAHLKFWKDAATNLQLMGSSTPGTMAGEGSAFYVLSSSPRSTPAVAIEKVHTFFTPSGAELDLVWAETRQFLDSAGISEKDVSILLAGMNGDSTRDRIYYDLYRSRFYMGSGLVMYKHLCGEYYTSTAFAVWLAAEIFAMQSVPGVVQLNPPIKPDLRNILIYNQYHNREHVLILLSHDEI